MVSSQHEEDRHHEFGADHLDILCLFFQNTSRFYDVFINDKYSV